MALKKINLAKRSSGMEDRTIYDTDFWRWLLNSELKSFLKEPIKHNEDFVKEAINPWEDSPSVNLDLKRNLCINALADVHDEKPLKEWLAKIKKVPLNVAEEYLAEYYNIYEDEKKTSPFSLNSRTLEWYKNGKASKRITNFNLFVESIVHRINQDTGEWEREFQTIINFKKDKSSDIVTHDLAIPFHCVLSKTAFKKLIFGRDQIMVYATNDEELIDFFDHIVRLSQPKEVAEYDHYGFIQHNNKPYYIASNVLIKIPVRKDDAFMLFAPDKSGIFNIAENTHLRLDKTVDKVPSFELGAVDPITNRYKNDEEEIINNFSNKQDYRHQLEKVSEHICHMQAGQKMDEFHYEGELLLYFIFSFHFFDEIFNVYKHVIFLYLSGLPNSGKGSMAKILLSFMGQGESSFTSDATKKSVENVLSYCSKIPSWADEFKPEEMQGNNPNVTDQMWNSWYELKARDTSSSGNRRRNEIKYVRGSVLFCSNYLPQGDHFNSRLLKITTSYEKRGSEEHVTWLMDNKRMLQQLFIGFFLYNPNIDREYFKDELKRLKPVIKQHIIYILKTQVEPSRLKKIVLKDRQIESLASLCVTEQVIKGKDKHIDGLLKLLEGLDDESSEEVRRTNETLLAEFRNSNVMKAGVKLLAQQAIEGLDVSPFYQFLDALAILIINKKIDSEYYSWSGNNLKIWFKGCYEVYRSNISNQRPIPKETIEQELRELSGMSAPKTVNWCDSQTTKRVTRHGYELPNVADDVRISMCFKSNQLD